MPCIHLKKISLKHDWNSARRNKFKRPAFGWLKKGIFCETTGSLESMLSEMIPYDRRVIGMGRSHY